MAVYDMAQGWPSLEETRKMAKRMFVSREGEPMTLAEMTKAMIAETGAPPELARELEKVGISATGEDLFADTQERAREVDRERVRRGYDSDRAYVSRRNGDVAEFYTAGSPSRFNAGDVVALDKNGRLIPAGPGDTPIGVFIRKSPAPGMRGLTAAPSKAQRTFLTSVLDGEVSEQMRISRTVPVFGQVGPTVDKRSREPSDFMSEFKPGEFYAESGVYIPTSAPQWVWQRDQSPSTVLPRWTLYDERRRPRYVATDLAVAQARDPQLMFETCTRKAIQERSLAEDAMGRQALRDFPVSWDEQQNGRLVDTPRLRLAPDDAYEKKPEPQPRALECVGASSRKIVLED